MRLEQLQKLGGFVFWWFVMIIVAVTIGYRVVVGDWPFFELEKSFGEGEIFVVTKPKGAMIQVDNRPISEATPTTIRLSRGQPYQLYVYLAGYQPWKQIVALGVKEEIRRLDITLIEKIMWGTLRVSTSHKADFFLDDRLVGTQTTELTIAQVQAGVDHQLKIQTLAKEPLIQKIKVEAGKVSVLHFDFDSNFKRVDRSIRGK